jgi:integrase
MAWLYKRGDSNVWWIGERINGKQILRSTGQTDKKLAEQQLANIKTAAMLHQAGNLTDDIIKLLTGRKSTQRDFSLRAMLAQWLTECKNLSPVTLRRYEAVTDEFCDFIKASADAPLLRDIQKESIALFLRDKRAKTSVANTKLNRKILAAFFNYCVSNDALENSPMPSATALKLTGESEKVRRAFTLAELETLFKKAPSPFWKYMVMAGYFLGQRMGDLICLTWGAIDFERGVVRLTQSKTGKAVILPLRPELGAMLAQLKRDAGDVKASEPIFAEQAARYSKHGSGVFSNEFYDLVLLPAGLVKARTHQKADKVNGEETNGSRTVSPVSFHCLRHSFVSFLKLTGAAQSTAMELAGHSSEQISNHYSHVDEGSMRNAIAALPQLN